MSPAYYLLISLSIYLNTCRAPHLKMSSEHFTMTTIALFSVSEETHCAPVVCHSERVTVDIPSDLLTAHFSSYTADAT